MAETRLADIYDATVYDDLPAENSPEKTDFADSGVAVTSPLLDARANSEGNLTDLPFWKDLDASVEPNYSSDDPSVSATPQKVAQEEQIARKAFLNEGWTSMDLATELSFGTDPLQHVRNRVDAFWMKQWQRRLIATSRGIHADNAANDGGDMTHDIAVEAAADQGTGTRWSQQAFINAAYTMGDMVDGVSAIAIHSMIAKQITEQNGAEDVRDSEGNLLYRTYLGRRMIVDDGLPAVAGTTDGLKYLSVLYGPGAIGYGQGTPTVPSEIDREPEKGDGGGMETLWTRKTWIIHPFGFKQTGTPTGMSFSLAELRAAAQWDRVVDRKNVPMAFLWTN